MTMIDRSMEPFVVMERERKTDGAGGVYTDWYEGLSFAAAISSVNTTLTTIGSALGTSSGVTITTDRNMELEFPDVVKRITTGKTYRIKTASADRRTPSIAGISYSQVDAEEWELTT